MAIALSEYIYHIVQKRERECLLSHTIPLSPLNIIKQKSDSANSGPANHSGEGTRVI
jgi:hypothetical protein